MSGHSHFSSIKHKKEITDKKRGKIFSKLSRQLSVTSREGGGDPVTNSKLRLVIELAKKINMPSDNIERAVKRGSGELEGVKLEPVIFEAYGPGGIALIIEGITDNRNRTVSEIKQILSQNGGKFAEGGSVKWLFERKGVITINVQFLLSNSKFKNKEELEIKVIEAGAEDIYWEDDALDIYIKVEGLEKVKKNLENQGIKVESASLDWVAKDYIIPTEKEKKNCHTLFEALDESEAVQEIYSNLKV